MEMGRQSKTQKETRRQSKNGQENQFAYPRTELHDKWPQHGETGYATVKDANGDGTTVKDAKGDTAIVREATGESICVPANGVTP